MSDHWSCRPELYILGTGPLCIHHHVSNYLTAASNAAEAEQEMVEAEYDAAAAAARAGIEEPMNADYSVWNWKTGRYDYYRSRNPRSYRATVGYPAARAIKGVGELPEQAVDPLPAGTVYIGSGLEAQGTLAAPRKRSSLLFLGVAGALLVLLWRK
jgi:hypothetical protein